MNKNFQSIKNLNESELIQIQSIINDLVDSVHIQQSIMSNTDSSQINENSIECQSSSMDLEESSYYEEAEQTFTRNPFEESLDKNETIKLIEGISQTIDPFSPVLFNRGRDETDLCQTDNGVFNYNEVILNVFYF